MSTPQIDYMRPEVKEKLWIWNLIDDCIKGEKAVKARGETYLPKPTCSDDEKLVAENYKNYKSRAVFYNATGRTHKGMVGQVFSKPSKTEIPDTLQPLIDNVDGAGMNLDQQARRALSTVIAKSRAGLLSDFPTIDSEEPVTRADVANLKPRIIYYHPGDIINWRESYWNGETVLSLVVLHETYVESDDGFETETKDQWRVLKLDTEVGGVIVQVWIKGTDKSNTFELKSEAVLKDSAGVVFTRIPFSFIGAENNDTEVDEPVLQDIAQLNIAHYRNSADYEESSYLCGQPTPVFSGLTEKWVDKYMTGKVILGSKSAVSLPEGASAQMLQAEPNNLPGEAMKKKEDQMKSLGAKLIEPGTVQRTATDAMLEADSESSVLSTVAENVSAAYRKAIYFCSLFIGQVEEKDIVYELNQDFAVNKMTAQERQQLVSEWQSGAITFDEMRTQLLKSGVANIEDHIDAKNQIEYGQDERVEEEV